MNNSVIRRDGNSSEKETAMLRGRERFSEKNFHCQEQLFVKVHHIAALNVKEICLFRKLIIMHIGQEAYIYIYIYIWIIKIFFFSKLIIMLV